MSAFGTAPPSTACSDTTNSLPSEVGGSAPAEQYMTNTSSLDVTVPPPRSSNSPCADEYDAKKPSPYPLAFAEHVEPHARQAVLEAGDVLVMPPRCVARLAFGHFAAVCETVLIDVPECGTGGGTPCTGSRGVSLSRCGSERTRRRWRTARPRRTSIRRSQRVSRCNTRVVCV